MMKKSQNTIKKILQGFLILATLITMIVLGVFLWSLVSDTPKEEPPIVDPSVKQTFNFEVNDFTLFEIEEFGFDFILANIHVESNKAINLSLSHFVTSEGIQLNSVDTYLNTIESLGYNFGDYNPVFSLTSTENTLDAVLFIPITNIDAHDLNINVNLYPVSTISFDLTKPSETGTVSNLGRNQQDVEPEEISEIIIDDVFIVSKNYFYTLDENGDRADAFFSSNSKIVGVKLTVKNKSNNPFRIQNAILTSKDNNVFSIIDPNYLIDGYVLIMKEYLTGTMSGFIFYEIFDQNYEISNVKEISILLSSIDVEKLYNITINE
jgi:hypothetical protein